MNTKRIFGLCVVIVVGVFGFIIGESLMYISSSQSSSSQQTSPIVANSPQNATYSIEGQSVTLVNGVSEVAAAPGSASKVITRYFGNAVTLDLNGDGRPDSVFILTQNTGGTGTFYYVVAALNMPNGYVGSHGLLLGDRIAPQTTEVSQNP